ncbi:MAG: hypothetical protein WC658_01245 [Candidatus Omnitrophota bacterium]
MTKSKGQNKSQCQNPKSKTKVLSFGICALTLSCALCFGICHLTSAQEPELEFTLDVTSETTPLPKIFKPSMDLSGRGFHRDTTWPQGLAAAEALDAWGKDIGFSGMYRLQYNLWEIHQLAKDKDSQNKLLSNYEGIIKRISDAGGIVILDIFGTPAGLGRVLDKKSPPVNLRAFKEIVKGHIKNLSCEKRYNIWYEVWSAPDLDDFFLGRKSEYLHVYRAIAEAVKELEKETKVHIPLGGPSVSAWFQNAEANTVLTPEHSLIYELIKFCYHYHLPLDFISWHSFSTAPGPEKETTIYKKTAVALIRDWLGYFKFDRATPLIVDEWNYDRNANVLSERQSQSYISASYIPTRLKNMHKEGLDYQLYFSLEDFQNNKEGVVRNTGVFWFDPEHTSYKGGPKSSYQLFKMLNLLGGNFFSADLKDEFTGVLAAKEADTITVLIYNYIDTQIATNFLSRNIAGLNPAERRTVLGIVQSNKLSRILSGQLDIVTLRTTARVKQLLEKAQDLNYQAAKFAAQPRSLKLKLQKLQGRFAYQRYVIDASCGRGCDLKPAQEQDLNIPGTYEEVLQVTPYSVQLVVLKPLPEEKPQLEPVPVKEEVPAETSN